MNAARLPSWPAWLYLAFLAYGSLVPLDFQARTPQDAWVTYLAMPWVAYGRFSLTDGFTNVMLYVPLAMLGLGALRGRFGRLMGAAAVWLGCVALSAGLEFAQIYMASRTPLLGDIVANGLGAALGILLWPLAGPHLIDGSAALAAQAGRVCPGNASARLAAALGLPPYFLALAWLTGWFESAWLPPDAALGRLTELHLAPFYHHYFADIGHALLSVVLVTAAFVPLGFAVWALRRRHRAGRSLLRHAAVWSLPVSGLLESGKLFLSDRQPDYTNLLFAALGAMLGCMLACRYASAAATTDRAAVQLGKRQRRSGVVWRLLATAALVASLVGLWHLPFARIPLAIGALLYVLLLLRYPQAWLVAVPALLPVLDLAPWSGRFFFDEFDLILLLTLAVGYGRHAGPSGGRPRLPSGLVFILGLFMLSCLISLAVALLPLAPLNLDAFAHYYSPYNALRVAKGFFWAFALLPLLVWQLRAGAQAGRLFTLGMTLGLAGTVLAIVWERAVFPGLADYSRDFRVAGLMSSMHTGGSHIEAHLVLALPFLAAFVASRRGWLTPLVGAALLLGGLYALAVTYARGGYAAAIVAGLILAVGWGMGGSRVARLRAIPYVLAAVLLAGLLVAPILGGQFAQYRLAKSESDAGVRLAHWREALEMRAPGWRTELFGMGLGRYPVTYFYHSPPEARPASFGYIVGHDGRPVLSLGAGTPLYVEQKLPVRHGQGYRIEVTARSLSGNAKLNVLVCERTYFDAFGCASASFELAGEWLVYRDRLTLNWPGGGGRPVTLSVENAAPGSVAEIQRIALLDTAGGDVINNGDFAQGTDHWYFSVFDHLPWHIKNLWVDMLFSQGWVGLIVFALLAGYGLIRIAGCGMRGGDLFCLSTLAGLAAFLTVSGVDSLFDAPRLTLLFFLTLLLGVLHAELSKGGARWHEHAATSRRSRKTWAERVGVGQAADGNTRVADTVAVPMSGFWRDLVVGVAVLAALGVAVTYLPGMPYNVKELIYRGNPVLSALLLAVFWFWFTGVPVLMARGLTMHTGFGRAYPFIALFHAATAALLVIAAVPSESLHDVVGAPILGWPWQLESLVRLTALFGAAGLLLTGGAWMARILVTGRGGAGVAAWVLTALPLLVLAHWVVVERAATDNLTELMAGGGGLRSSAAMTAWVLLMATVGSLLGRFAAGRGLKPTATLLWIFAALPLSYGLMLLGTETLVIKYGQRFSALQFLLSADRAHLASGAELAVRYGLACLGGLLALALAQRPFFRLAATRADARTTRAR